MTPGEPAYKRQATEFQVKGVSNGQKDGKKIQGNLTAGKEITQRLGVEEESSASSDVKRL